MYIYTYMYIKREKTSAYIYIYIYIQCLAPNAHVFAYCPFSFLLGLFGTIGGSLASESPKKSVMIPMT